LNIIEIVFAQYPLKQGLKPNELVDIPEQADPLKTRYKK
jgi:hypothetical protein